MRTACECSSRMMNVVGLAAIFVLAAPAARADDSAVSDARLLMPDGYVAPAEPAVVEHLEWVRDQKLGLLMHFGL